MVRSVLLPRPVAQIGGYGWGKEAEVAAVEHDGGDAGHNGLALDLKVAVHLVRPPPPNEADAVGVDAATQHGHCPAGPSGASGDITGGKVREGWWE